MRLALVPIVLVLSYWWPSGTALAACVIVGVLSDWLDGVFARRLGVATPRLRRYDSGTDVLFYLSLAWAAWVLHRDIIVEYGWGIAALIGLEVVCNVLSLSRFGRPPATHSLAAKIWALVLCAGFVALFAFGRSRGWMDAVIVWGIIADVEVIAILLVSKRPPVDVLTILHAWRGARRHIANEDQHRRAV
jgi:CDP-diacylglycerol--glycerol-3-phosphate 3-phosphatidyltransferase